VSRRGKIRRRRRRRTQRCQKGEKCVLLLLLLLPLRDTFYFHAVFKAVHEFVRMREITRSVEVAPKCLITVVLVDVDLPY